QYKKHLVDWHHSSLSATLPLPPDTEKVSVGVQAAGALCEKSPTSCLSGRGCRLCSCYCNMDTLYCTSLLPRTPKPGTLLSVLVSPFTHVIHYNSAYR
uniref:Agouti domain-containing protein n=1 Tax=Echeneis naucrates TaxID=173247 RepID=A0A665WX11_ECHNA